MRKKQDIVYEKDLGLDFGFPEFDEPVEEETAPPQGGVPVEDAANELQDSTTPPPVTPHEVMDSPPDWSSVGEDDSFAGADRLAETASARDDIEAITVPRLEELENKIDQLENKMDRIVSLLAHISDIYGNKVSS